MRQLNSRGFSALEGLLVIAVVVILGLVGYNVYNRQHKADDTATTASQPSTTSNGGSATASDVASGPSDIKSTSDLDKAAATLDQTDPGGSNNSDSSQLSSQASSF